MSKFILLLGVLSLGTGCAYGPFTLTHERGHMPKGHVALPLDAKLRVLTVNQYEIDGVKVVWKGEF